MKLIISTLAFCLCASVPLLAQTANVQKKISDNTLTGPVVVPSGGSITINAGGTLTNNGTATGFGGTWGSITGTLANQTDLVTALGLRLAAASNLSDLANAATARTNLGLAIGTNVQAYNASLAAIAAGTWTGSTSITTLGEITTGASYDYFNNVGEPLVKYSDTGYINASGVYVGAWSHNQAYSYLTNSELGFYAAGGSNASIIRRGSSITTARILTTPDASGVIVCTGDTGTVTNTMLAGSIAYSKLSLTGAILNADLAGSIANAKLANSAITIGGASTSLGGTVTATTILDSLGSTQGSILYRNGNAWVPLTPGTAGQVLQSGGAAANPFWATVSSGITIGTTAITSGTAGRPLYETSGNVVGEYTGLTITSGVLKNLTVTPATGTAGVTITGPSDSAGRPTIITGYGDGLSILLRGDSHINTFEDASGNNNFSWARSVAAGWGMSAGRGIGIGADDSSASPSIFLMRSSATVMTLNGTTPTGTKAQLYLGTLRLDQVTVAGLPAASTAGAGALAYVTDANSTTAGSTVAGSGSNKALVVSDGTNWKIVVGF